MINLHEFYHQLGLLVKSKLPLPDSMRQLERTLKGPLYGKIEKDLEAGLSLHESLGKYPGAFPKEHLQLIQLAEERNTLSETLVELAKYSHFEKIILTKVKDILFYPFIIIATSLIMLGFVGQIFIYPVTKDLFPPSEMGFGDDLPLSYRLSILVGKVTHDYALWYWAFVILLLSFLLMIAMNIFNIRKINELWLKGSSLWTDFRSVFQSSRLCSFLSLQFRNNIGLHDSCRTATAFVDSSLASELELCSKEIEMGVSSKDIFMKCNVLDPLIISTLENSDENSLADEMSKLSDHYFERVYNTSERLVTYWKIITTLGTALVVLGILRMMMAPLIFLVRNM